MRLLRSTHSQPHPCAPAGRIGWCCLKTFDRKLLTFLWPRRAPPTTIAICSGPLKFGGTRAFGVFAPDEG